MALQLLKQLLVNGILNLHLGKYKGQKSGYAHIVQQDGTQDIMVAKIKPLSWKLTTKFLHQIRSELQYNLYLFT